MAAATDLRKERAEALRVLEFEPSAKPSFDELKASYRRLVLYHHPDKAAHRRAVEGDDALANTCDAQMFLRIHKAYEFVTKDNQLRPSLYSGDRRATTPTPSTNSGDRFAATTGGTRADEKSSRPAGSSRVDDSMSRFEQQWAQRAADIKNQARAQWQRHTRHEDRAGCRSYFPSRPACMSPGPTEGSLAAARRAAEREAMFSNTKRSTTPSRTAPTTPRKSPRQAFQEPKFGETTSSMSGTFPATPRGPTRTEQPSAGGTESTPRPSTPRKATVVTRRRPTATTSQPTTPRNSSREKETSGPTVSPPTTPRGPSAGTPRGTRSPSKQSEQFSVQAPFTSYGMPPALLLEVFGVGRTEAAARLQLAAVERAARALLMLHRSEAVLRDDLTRQSDRFFARLRYSRLSDLQGMRESSEERKEPPLEGSNAAASKRPHLWSVLEATGITHGPSYRLHSLHASGPDGTVDPLEALRMQLGALSAEGSPIEPSPLPEPDEEEEDNAPPMASRPTVPRLRLVH